MLQKCVFIMIICTHDTINPYKLRCMFNLNLTPWMQVESLAATVQRCSKLSSLFKILRDAPKRVSTQTHVSNWLTSLCLHQINPDLNSQFLAEKSKSHLFTSSFGEALLDHKEASCHVFET